jgi:hypothetical protein
MKTISKVLSIVLLALLVTVAASATNLTQTTLSSALTSTASFITVASATGISGPSGGFMQKLYIVDPGGHKGELVTVVGAPVGTTIPIARVDQFISAHKSGSIVLIAPMDPTMGGFYSYAPYGPVPSSVQTSPWVDVVTGNQFLASNSGVWVAGWNAPDSIGQDATTAVASAASQVTPSGPLFHMTGALGVTGFNIPVGFAGGCFTVIADGAWTWTAANNIAVASSAGQAVGSAVTFCYDTANSKFYPSHQ